MIISKSIKVDNEKNFYENVKFTMNENWTKLKF